MQNGPISSTFIYVYYIERKRNLRSIPRLVLALLIAVTSRPKIGTLRASLATQDSGDYHEEHDSTID